MSSTLSEVNTKKYFRIIIIILMITTYLPVVYLKFPPYLGSHHFWTIVWGLSLILFYPKLFKDKLMILLIGYFIFIVLLVYVFSYSMNHWNRKMLMHEIYQIGIGASIYLYFQLSRDYLGYSITVKLVLLFIFITSVMTIITSFIEPMYARMMFSAVREGDEELVNLIRRFGAGTYGTAIVFMALLPLMVYQYKRNLFGMKFTRMSYLFLIILFLLSLIRMQIVTNIIVAVVFTFLALILESRKRWRIILTGLIVAIALASVPKKAYIDMLNNISISTKNYEEISYKFRSIADFIEFGNDNIDSKNAVKGRISRFPMLLDSFIENPVFGCFFVRESEIYDPDGGHLYWMNKVTITGVLGLIIFSYIIYYFIRLQRKILSPDYLMYYYLSVLTILVYGLFKNVVGRECWYLFFVIAPGINYLSFSKKK